MRLHPAQPHVPVHPQPFRSARRRLRVAAVAATLSLGLLAVNGCSSAVGEARGTGGGSDDQILTIAATSDIVPATIFTNSAEASNTLIGSVYDSLVDYDLDSLEPRPRLATDWKLSPEGTQLVLNLRDDVTFHSGRAFTSKDVEFSIKTWADPRWTVQFQRTAAAVTGFDTTDPHRITLTFEHPLSNVFDLLDTLPIIDSDSIDDLASGKEYVGTGPFRFTSWTPGASLKLTRNDDYWGEEPALGGVEVTLVPDAQAQAAQLRAGQVDLATGASPRDIASLSKDDAFEVSTFAGAENEIYVGADLNNPALKDKRVRQALAWALDRERIVKEVYQGNGRPANLPWSATGPGYDAATDATYTHDVTKAKALLAKSSSTGVLPTLPLSYPAGNATYEAVAQIVQANLSEVGITVELKPIEYTAFIKSLIGGTFGGLWILQHNYAQYTPSTLAVSAYPFNAEHNASHFVSTEYQAASEAAWKRPNGTDAEAIKAYRRLNQVLLDNVFLVEIAVLPPQIVASSGVEGLDLSKRNELDLRTATVER